MLITPYGLTRVRPHGELVQPRAAVSAGSPGRIMRLLDLVAQCREPVVIVADARRAQSIKLTGPNDFAHKVAECPLRFVMADDLTRASAELAFADGDRLASCLDLLRIPAPSLWVEWSDAVHQQVIHDCGVVAQPDPAAPGRRAGLLLRATPNGRSGIARTFWSASTPDGECE